MGEMMAGVAVTVLGRVNQMVVMSQRTTEHVLPIFVLNAIAAHRFLIISLTGSRAFYIWHSRRSSTS